MRAELVRNLPTSKIRLTTLRLGAIGIFCRNAYKGPPSMTDDVSAAGWVVEVLGEGLGARHRRFMVGTSDRDAAIKLVCELLGPNTLVTASSRIDGKAVRVARLKPGEIVPI